jgi:hypothetical protein
MSKKFLNVEMLDSSVKIKGILNYKKQTKTIQVIKYQYLKISKKKAYIHKIPCLLKKKLMFTVKKKRMFTGIVLCFFFFSFFFNSIF